MADIRIKHTDTLSSEPGKLTRTTYDIRAHDGQWMQQQREVYRRDDGSTVLLYNLDKRTVLLTRQFRLPVHLHGASGYLIETVAGLLEGADPARRIKAEIKEETGYEIDEVEELGEGYMSPAAVIEKVIFFTAPYRDDQKTGPGGGLKKEGEDLEVLELPFDEAYAMLRRGEITDGKTVILLQHAKLHIFP